MEYRSVHWFWFSGLELKVLAPFRSVAATWILLCSVTNCKWFHRISHQKKRHLMQIHENQEMSSLWNVALMLISRKFYLRIELATLNFTRCQPWPDFPLRRRIIRRWKTFEAQSLPIGDKNQTTNSIDFEILLIGLDNRDGTIPQMSLNAILIEVIQGPYWFLEVSSGISGSLNFSGSFKIFQVPSGFLRFLQIILGSFRFI